MPEAVCQFPGAWGVVGPHKADESGGRKEEGSPERGIGSVKGTQAWVKAKTGSEAEGHWFLPMTSTAHHAGHVSGLPGPLWSRKGPCAIREGGRFEHGHPDTGGTWLLSKPVFAPEAESPETGLCTAVPPAHHGFPPWSPRSRYVSQTDAPSMPPRSARHCQLCMSVTSHDTLSPPLRGNTLCPESSSLSPTDPRLHGHCSRCAELPAWI